MHKITSCISSSNTKSSYLAFFLMFWFDRIIYQIKEKILLRLWFINAQKILSCCNHCVWLSCALHAAHPDDFVNPLGSLWKFSCQIFLSFFEKCIINLLFLNKLKVKEKYQITSLRDPMHVKKSISNMKNKVLLAKNFHYGWNSTNQESQDLFSPGSLHHLCYLRL